jgi:hypothetical protein
MALRLLPLSKSGIFSLIKWLEICPKVKCPILNLKKCKNLHLKKKAGLSFWVLSFNRMFDPLFLYLHFHFQMGVSLAGVSFYLIWQGFIKIFLPLAKQERFQHNWGIYEFVNNHASKECQQLKLVPCTKEIPILNNHTFCRMHSKDLKQQGITNTLTLPIDKMLYIYLLCPHSLNTRKKSIPI